MNTETMITELNAVAEKHKNDKLFTFQTNITAMCRDVIPKLEQLAEYEAIGTVEECRQAREKQRAKKPVYPYLKSIPTCPNCGEVNLQHENEYGNMDANYDFCPDCGQSIDWSDAD